MIETLDDVIESLADSVGIYGAHFAEEAHPCRCCWTADIKKRIKAAMDLERALSVQRRAERIADMKRGRREEVPF